MSVQGQPAVIVPATTQTPKAIIPAEIRNESTVSMIAPFLHRLPDVTDYTPGPT
jgi:hypothetical protein